MSTLKLRLKCFKAQYFFLWLQIRNLVDTVCYNELFKFLEIDNHNTKSDTIGKLS